VARVRRARTPGRADRMKETLETLEALRQRLAELKEGL